MITTYNSMSQDAKNNEVRYLFKVKKVFILTIHDRF